MRKLPAPTFLLAASLLLMAVPPLDGQTPTRPEVVKLDFDGNHSFASRALANAIITRETTCRSTVLLPFCWSGREFALDRAFLNSRTLRDDYVRLHLFYRRAGFREAQVDTLVNRLDGNEVELTFLVEEGEPVRIGSLELVGVDEVEGGSLTRNLPVGVGDRLDLLELDAVRDTLTQRLRNRGYAHADVLRNLFIPSGSYEAEVEFDIYTGPRARFGEIEITGNEQITEAVIRRMLPFQPGSYYSREQIFQGQRNLYNLEIFRHAAITDDLEHLPDSIVPLTVTVNEGNTHRVRTGGGWNTAECFNTESRWVSRNFRGGARRLVLRGRLSNLLTPTLEESICSGAGTGPYGELNWGVSVDFTQPWIFSPRNTLSASIFAERQSLQDVFVRQAVGLNLSLMRLIGRQSHLTLSYRPQLARLDAAEIFFCTSFLVCDPVDIDVLQASNRLAPVGLTFSRDRTNRAFSPTEGYTLGVDVEHASVVTGSNFDYERVVAEATAFHPLFGETVVAGHLRGGWLNAREFRGLRALADEGVRIAHPQKRFYAGGGNSVRGFAQNQLGPRVVSAVVENLVFPVGGREAAICTPESIVDLSCDASALDDRRFLARPTGGSALLEGSIELRFPIWELVRGAMYLDFGQVWDSPSDAGLGDLIFTPGTGIRYETPIGPIRVDVAYRIGTIHPLPVVTSLLRPFDPGVDGDGDRIRDRDGNTLDWVRLEDLALLQPRIPFEDVEPWAWRRLQLHFSIGQAF